MVNWNPGAPDVLGNQWMPNHSHQSRVFGGAPARRQRLPSTSAETISKLRASVAVNPLLKFHTHTLIDVCVEGNEDTALYQPVELVPTGTAAVGNWHRSDGSQNNLHIEVDSDVTQWYPGAPATAEWVETDTNDDAFLPTFDVSAFAGGGSHQNARIGFVEIKAIYGANTGFRELRTSLLFSGVEREPAGGSLREVHGFGATYFFWYGELNPSTLKPWTPADIVQLGAAGTTRVQVRSVAATPWHWPRIHAVRVWVWAIPTDNRVAVGVWKRPPNLTSRLNNVETDALLTVPSGAANWAKANATNYTFTFRQSVSPALAGAVYADDVLWNGAYQDLGPVGQPPGVTYPLHTSGNAPPPSTVPATDDTIYDQFGRPIAGDFAATGTPAYGLALIRSDLAVSADSQPYRIIWPEDRVVVSSTQKLGQRITPGASLSYLLVRFTIIPPPSGNPTLTAAIHRVSDGVQIGGTFTITAEAARALPAFNSWRYISGFLSSGASLVSGTAYEIRLTSSAGGEWVAAMLDCSLGNTASFGGSTNGAFIGATHFPDRELCITITRQPDPPTSPAAALTNVAVTTFADAATTVQHVQVSWTAPGVGLGASFARYEVERQLAGGAWQRVADIVTSSIVTWVDRTVPRGVAATYRIRAVATDGRFSAWATTGAATTTDTRAMLILASNHVTDQFVHLYEITGTGDAETVYPMLSAEGDEVVAIHGADYQVVFMEHEDRGVGWRTRVSLAQNTLTTVGMARFAALRQLVRSLEVPYLCILDHQGNHVLGHVAVKEGLQTQPAHHYSAQLEVTPTHAEPVPVTVS